VAPLTCTTPAFSSAACTSARLARLVAGKGSSQTASSAPQVVDFHEAPLEEAGATLRSEGEASLPVDETLVKRALSNVIGNATRFAERGTAIVVHIENAARSRRRDPAPAHQRSTRGPRAAPTAPVQTIPSVYQMATNAGEASGQDKE
jgi:two-component system heavy metal sensor histidine kinase CusS